MKTVEVIKTFDYRPHRAWSVRFEAGITYRRVIEAAACALVAADAGRIVPTTAQGDDAAGNTVDCWNVWRRW